MISSIKDIICPQAHLAICTDDCTLKIKENGVDSKIKKLTIKGIPEEAFAFTLDFEAPKSSDRRNFYKQLSAYIRNDNDCGVNKGCDLILVYKKSDEFRALVFDLKSEKPCLSKTAKQLLNSEIFLKFIKTLADTYYADTKFSSLNISQAIVTVDNSPQNKGSVYKGRRKSPANSKYPFKIHKTRISVKKEATVHFGALIQ